MSDSRIPVRHAAFTAGPRTLARASRPRPRGGRRGPGPTDPAASLSHVLICPLGGALSRIRADEMALDVPEEGWACECYGLWPPVESLDRGAIEWVEGVGEAIAPHATAPARRHDVHERLARIRERWDPGGVFARQPAP